MNKRQAKKVVTKDFNTRHHGYRDIKRTVKRMGVWKCCRSQFENYCKWFHEQITEMEEEA